MEADKLISQRNKYVIEFILKPTSVVLKMIVGPPDGTLVCSHN